MNLIYSNGCQRDEVLKAEGHRFLGAGKGGNDGRKEIHAFLKKGEKLCEEGDKNLIGELFRIVNNKDVSDKDCRRMVQDMLLIA